MLRTVVPAVIYLVITSTKLGDGCKIGTSSFTQIHEIRNFDDALFPRSVRDETFVINVVVASEKENRFLDLVIEKYNGFAPILVQTLGRKYWPKSSGPEFHINAIDFVLGFYDTTDRINAEELELAFGSTWSPRARIILWVCGAADRTLDDVFKDFWRRDVLNVDLVVQDSSTKRWEVFTYNPFVTGVNGVRGSIEKLESNAPELFPDKLTDLRNHSIPISVFKQFPIAMVVRKYENVTIGTDTELLRTISQTMNFHIDAKTSKNFFTDYVTVLKDNQRTGVVGDIINGRSDAIWNRQYIDDYPKKIVEITYPRYETKTCIIVQKADQVPMIIRVVLPFPLIIWLAVFAVLGILLIFMNLSKEKDIFPRLVRLLLFQNLGEIPKRNLNRIYSISWISWSLLIAVIYQANLIKDLMFPRYYKDIDTSDDLYDRNITIFISNNMHTLVNNSEIESWRRFVDRAKTELIYKNCLDRIIKGEAVACATPDFIADFLYIYVRNNAKNGPELHKMKEYLGDHWQAFMVKRGFPYLDKFDRIIERLVEGGFDDKWIKDVLLWVLRHKPTHDDSVLTMKHLKGIFDILLIGIAISTLTFILEICHGRYCDAGHGRKKKHLQTVRAEFC